ncbi:MAG: hypothetical protein N2515_10705, partial [Deltaproteobacteria bacterium]|nr:hypothetical protein [Deltaproteobacteria bacterium]
MGFSGSPFGESKETGSRKRGESLREGLTHLGWVLVGLIGAVLLSYLVPGLERDRPWVKGDPWP